MGAVLIENAGCSLTRGPANRCWREQGQAIHPLPGGALLVGSMVGKNRGKRRFIEGNAPCGRWPARPRAHASGDAKRASRLVDDPDHRRTWRYARPWNPPSGAMLASHHRCIVSEVVPMIERGGATVFARKLASGDTGPNFGEWACAPSVRIPAVTGLGYDVLDHPGRSSMGAWP
jgi:hypothetical protein